MKTRILSSVLGLPLLIFFFYKGGLFLKIALIAVSYIANYEMKNAFGRRVGVEDLTSLLVIISLYFVVPSASIAIIFIYLFILMGFAMFLNSITINEITVYGFSLAYTVIPFYLLYQLREASVGGNLVWLVFLIAWGSDTFAYFVGKKFGKRKLAPEISPKKTIEGSVGGIVGAAALSLVFSYFFLKEHNPFIIAALALIGSALSQVGDLAASFIKRKVGIKDYGNLIPGHGGILDRFDSIFIVIVIVYYYHIIMTF